MIKSAAAILAAIKEAEKNGTFDVPAPRGPGRPWLGKKCKATKFGVCYQAVAAGDMCYSHLNRFKTYGDPYAGKPIKYSRTHCPYCKKVQFQRYIFKPKTHTRAIVVIPHKLSDNVRECPGSLRTPVPARTAEFFKREKRRAAEKARNK